MRSFFETPFGDAWLNFSDNVFKHNTQKTSYFGTDENDEQSGDKYIYHFPLGKDINTDLLKVNVDTKTGRLNVKYNEDTEKSYVHFEYIRTIPSDAIAKTAHAETSDGQLTITFDKDKGKTKEDVTTEEIPIDFGE